MLQTVIVGAVNMASRSWPSPSSTARPQAADAARLYRNGHRVVALGWPPTGQYVPMVGLVFVLGYNRMFCHVGRARDLGDSLPKFFPRRFGGRAMGIARFASGGQLRRFVDLPVMAKIPGCWRGFTRAFRSGVRRVLRRCCSSSFGDGRPKTRAIARRDRTSWGKRDERWRDER